MARTAKAPALNAKIYRHFALATLMLTGAVALIANDHNDTAEAAEDTGPKVDQVQLAIEKDNADRKSRKAKSRSFDRWGVDRNFYGTNTADYDVHATSQMANRTPSSRDVLQRIRAKGPPPGMSYEEWLEYLEEQEAMLAANGSVEAGPVQSQASIGDMIARSRERSGGGSEFN